MTGSLPDTFACREPCTGAPLTVKPLFTWSLQGLFPLDVGLGVDVAGDVVEGEEEVVLLVQLDGKLNLHLQTRGAQRSDGRTDRSMG